MRGVRGSKSYKSWMILDVFTWSSQRLRTMKPLSLINSFFNTWCSVCLNIKDYIFNKIYSHARLPQIPLPVLSPDGDSQSSRTLVSPFQSWHTIRLIREPLLSVRPMARIRHRKNSVTANMLWVNIFPQNESLAHER